MYSSLKRKSASVRRIGKHHGCICSSLFGIKSGWLQSSWNDALAMSASATFLSGTSDGTSEASCLPLDASLPGGTMQSLLRALEKSLGIIIPRAWSANLPRSSSQCLFSFANNRQTSIWKGESLLKQIGLAALFQQAFSFILQGLREWCSFNSKRQSNLRMTKATRKRQIKHLRLLPRASLSVDAMQLLQQKHAMLNWLNKQHAYLHNQHL